MEDSSSPVLSQTTPLAEVGVSSSHTDAMKLATDSSHPFFIHPSDSPGMMLVNTPFTGKGYAGWKRGILIALSAKNKLGFIDGSIPEPKISSESYKSWSRCNDMVISWLLNALSREIAESVLYCKTAKYIWNELEERFGQTNGPQLYQLQKQISELTQGNLDIAAYYTRLKRFWDELDSLDTFQYCTCDCSCGGKEKSSKSQQDSRLIQFLMGLNDAYSGPRSNLLMISPLPSVNLAYSLLIRDEKQREVQIIGQPSEGAFFSTRQQSNVNRSNLEKRVFTEHSKGALFCTYCKKKNHVVDNCYRLIGFPADFKFTKSKRMGTGPKSNVALTNEEGESNFGNSRDRPITQDQYHNLCQLLQHVKTGSPGEQVPSDSAIANCAGPFNEEASGAW